MDRPHPSISGLARHGAAAPGCRVCGRPLSALARVRGDVCDAMDCRRRATDDGRRAEREALLADTVRRAATDLHEPALRDAPVVWLSHHDKRLVDLTPDDRDEQRDYLVGLEAAAHGPDPASPEDEPDPADDHADPAISGRLCAFCAGRCCRTGGQHHAFIRAPLVRRWLARHPDRTWPDAVAAYIAALPPRHVDGSCLHHGARGCTLPREMRSDICNEYACDPLIRVRTLATADPALRIVAGVVQGHGLGTAAIVSGDGAKTIG